MNSADLSAYLSRIGLDAALSETPSPSLDLLVQIQRAHRRHIPFENLDIHLGRAIELTPEAIFAKLVVNNRGGYCFEQNALFLDALTSLGFVGRPALGRVWLGASAASPTEASARTHAVTLVTLEGVDWLADAGFGAGDTPVLRLTEQRMVTADGAEHQLRSDPDYGWMLLRNSLPQCSFTLDPVWPADLIQANHYTSTFPSSRLVKNIIVSVIGSEGFVSLVNDKLTIPGNSHLLRDDYEYREVLSRYFGLKLSEDEWSRLKPPVFGQS